ncbi:MAG: CRISPR-associated helicase Cas3' [Porticoccaceae bacterium]
MTSDSALLKYWGKADPAYPGEPKWHPLAYHCLDVAACGQVLLRRQPAWLATLARLSGLDPEALSSWLIFLLAIHDLGKFGNGFQSLRPDLFGKLRAEAIQVGYDVRHDTLGYAVLMEHLPAWLERPHLAERGGNLLRLWAAAVTGHHGRPPKNDGLRGAVRRHFPMDPVLRDAGRFVAEVRHLLLPDNAMQLARADVERYKQASWLVAGLAVATDWLGSNTRWFEYRTPDLALTDYWKQVALQKAAMAVAESGLLAANPARDASYAKLFPRIAATPTPLQAWADTISIAPGPQIFVLEELTGGGKTEAALTLAARLMAAGRGHGVYFALPTMATADAMFGRVQKREGETDEPWQRFFSTKDASLVLAHSAAKTKQKLDTLQRRDAGYDARREEEASASQHSTAWLADSRKKALLADFGVGTVDQVLLGVMPLRHQSLRLLGLSTKVLVVDEVHACDSYMGELLARLLHFHAAMGGSAILLSATLPLDQRVRLLNAFAAGVGFAAEAPMKTDYPLATHLYATKPDEYPIQAREAVSRVVVVEPLADEAAVFQRLYATVSRGGCAVWVRNTVADAVSVWHAWSANHPDCPATLFHARFALCDRLRIGEEINDNFGPKSTDETRRGELVIATQVVEQSLDVDFDDMVSDLAPIDLIIQRAGRLQRHKRDADGNPANTDERSGAKLGVLMPEPIEDAGMDWFKSLLSKAAKVYPDHGKLWLTAQWLVEHKAFDLSVQARDMIETVYGAYAYERTPVALQCVTDKAEGACRADQGIARSNVLVFNQGYDPKSNEWPDEDSYTDITTRLGEKTVRLRLAKMIDDSLTPWATTGTSLDWPLSELTVARYLIAKESRRHTALLEQARKSMIDEGRYCLIVPLTDCGQDWRGWAMNAQDEEVRVIYSPVAGLSIEKGEAIDESDL